jgi:hypothetical protein
MNIPTIGPSQSPPFIAEAVTATLAKINLPLSSPTQVSPLEIDITMEQTNMPLCLALQAPPP